MTAAGFFFLCAGLTTFVAGTAIETAPVITSEQVQSIQQGVFDIFPIAGGALAAAGICFLHNEREGLRKIAGRVIFCMLAAFVSPWVVELLPLKLRFTDSRALVLLGALAGSGGYIFSRYFVEIIFKRAFGISERVADQVEHRLVPKGETNDRK